MDRKKIICHVKTQGSRRKKNSKQIANMEHAWKRSLETAGNNKFTPKFTYFICGNLTNHKENLFNCIKKTLVCVELRVNSQTCTIENLLA